MVIIIIIIIIVMFVSIFSSSIVYLMFRCFLELDCYVYHMFNMYCLFIHVLRPSAHSPSCVI